MGYDIIDINRKKSLIRSNELDKIAIDDNKHKSKVRLGCSESSKRLYENNKNKILNELNASQEDWENPKWQLKNRISDVDEILKYTDLSKKDYDDIRKVSEKHRFAITPYYFSLIDFSNPNCPIKLQSVPSIKELDESGQLDPMCEEQSNPSGRITRRYPNKLIINVTNACPMYCRHCQRRRLIGNFDKHAPKEYIDESIDFIANHEAIREVLVTGGDALLLSNNQLENIFEKLSQISHVDVIRVGTRTLATLPFRIDNDLAVLLRKYRVQLSTHFNHACEITPQAVSAVDMLVDHGVLVRNQMVLLHNVNDDKYCIQKTNEELQKYRVIPYYLFHPKDVKSTKHFQVDISKGLEIMKHLEGRTSGMCKPTYVYNSPGGLGKIPLVPMENIEQVKNGYKLTTWENKIIKKDFEN
ncbi:MAG: KamA family radical SAM protein [Methanobrevibacter sp.]|uniref:KamA family radical SAM protein n=1 Tax=Methanobrevibacter sp. TaxID=66852 RepID=UPI002E78D532|nr:KamA family radical SAM protein [Methanobrevibacter sp.]MEE0943493.1 KamA family radical SAM protein [Methanobrevibacter sp.]